MLLTCCIQYASKFAKLSSGHSTGKGQSQRKAMPNNVQITVQLHSFHMLARLCSKSFKLRFNSTWTVNFLMFKLDLGKAEEPEIKLPKSAGSWRKQENSTETSSSASLTTFKPLTVWIITNYGNLFRRWEYQTTLPVLGETWMRVKKQQNSIWNSWLVPNWKRSAMICYIVTLFT